MTGSPPDDLTGREPDTFRLRIAHLVYASAERAAMALPERLGRRVFALAGAAAFHLAPRVRGVVEGNLARVLGVDPRSTVVEAAAREAFDSYARYWYGMFRIRVMPKEEFLGRFRAVGAEHIAAAVEAGRGAVLALPHLGNWDAAGKWVHLNGWEITAVAELLRPRSLFDLFRRHREALGLSIVPLYDATSVGQELASRMSDNELVALVADRDLKGKGVVCEMFGAPRRLPAGPALLALATGAPLLPSAVYDVDDGWMVVIQPPLEIERTGDMRRDVTALTRALAREFERAIAGTPTQWHMFQSAWGEGGGASAAPEPGTAPAAERAAER
ncbi:MAG: phosphatidylinositol mannoside acyltransferase [Actinomycetota bacterium]